MGLDSASQCTPTPAGYYSLKQSSSPSGKCDPGYYCPVSSTTATAVACPAGTYNSIYGGDSEHSCRDCPSGFYCGALATVTPSICPIGKYSSFSQ